MGNVRSGDLSEMVNCFAKTRDEHVQRSLVVDIFRWLCEINEECHSTMVSRVRHAVDEIGVFRDHSVGQGVVVYKVSILTEYLRKSAGGSVTATRRMCSLANELANDGREIPDVRYPHVVGFRGFHSISGACLNPTGYDAGLIEARAAPDDGSSVQRSPQHMSMMRLTRQIGNLEGKQVQLKRSVGRLQGTMRRLEGEMPAQSGDSIPSSARAWRRGSLRRRGASTATR
jgi:hypothetical protein